MVAVLAQSFCLLILLSVRCQVFVRVAFAQIVFARRVMACFVCLVIHFNLTVGSGAQTMLFEACHSAASPEDALKATHAGILLLLSPKAFKGMPGWILTDTMGPPDQRNEEKAAGVSRGAS